MIILISIDIGRIWQAIGVITCCVISKLLITCSHCVVEIPQRMEPTPYLSWLWPQMAYYKRMQIIKFDSPVGANIETFDL